MLNIMGKIGRTRLTKEEKGDYLDLYIGEFPKMFTTEVKLNNGLKAIVISTWNIPLDTPESTTFEVKVDLPAGLDKDARSRIEAELLDRISNLTDMRLIGMVSFTTTHLRSAERTHQIFLEVLSQY